MADGKRRGPGRPPKDDPLNDEVRVRTTRRLKEEFEQVVAADMRYVSTADAIRGLMVDYIEDAHRRLSGKRNAAIEAELERYREIVDKRRANGSEV